MEKHIKAVRELLADYPELNYASQKEAFSGEDIDFALRQALDYFNQHPPYPTRYTVETMPYLYTWYLLAMVFLYRKLLTEESAVMELGGSVPSVSRIQLYNAVLGILENTAETQTSAIKHQLNLSASFGVDPVHTYPPTVWW